MTREMSEESVLVQLDGRIKILREETGRDVRDFADEKPVYALTRMYSKLKMFCEFYDSLRRRAASDPSLPQTYDTLPAATAGTVLFPVVAMFNAAAIALLLLIIYWPAGIVFIGVSSGCYAAAYVQWGRILVYDWLCRTFEEPASWL